MAVKKIPPFMGVDNLREDAALEVGGNSPHLFVRDAVNINFTETGRVEMRAGISKITDSAFEFMWQSPLHGDCFAKLNHDWVKVDPQDWSFKVLIQNIAQGRVEHIVLNNRVLMCCETGLYVYDGIEARTFTIDTPAAPILNQVSHYSGGLSAGTYAVAISWVNANGMESALSELTNLTVSENSAFEIVLPYCFDRNVSHVKLYITDHEGGELLEYESLDITNSSAMITSVQNLSRSAANRHLTQMRSGHSLALWRGRLMVADRNVLYFSEPMNYHLMDSRFNFVQFPQRIRFAIPVDAGIWVGQQDHVVFLRGNDLKGMVLERKASQAPIPHSAMLLSSKDVSAEISQGGLFSALWLANGYVIGTASGQIVELHRQNLKQIHAENGQSVGLGGRILTLVS